MRASAPTTAIAFATCLLAAPAFAQDYSPWSFGGSIGADIPINGQLHGEGVSNSIDLATLNSNLSGNGVISIRGRDYKDLYDTGIRANVEVRYAMSEMAEFFGSISYMQAKGKRGNIGCVDIATTAGACNAEVDGLFSDLKQIGAEVGYRQWFATNLFGGNVKPYFAVRGGVVHTDAIRVAVSTGATPLANLRLYEESWNFMIGGDIGATVAISPNAEIGGEVGLRYVTELKADDSDFGGIGLGSINDADSGRLSVPVSVRLNAVF